MAKPICCQEVGEHLVRHGMPPWRIERITDELAEHWEELHRAALDRGFSRNEAIIEANRRLGRPDQLAEAAISGLRRRSWMGRHPLVAVCAVPLILPILVICIPGIPFMLLDHWFHFTDPFLIARPANAHLLTFAARITYDLATIGSVIWLCRKAWERGLGLRWVFALCTWFTLGSQLRYLEPDAVGRHVTVGLEFPARLTVEQIILLVIHLLVAFWFFVMARRLQRRSTELLLQDCVSKPAPLTSFP